MQDFCHIPFDDNWLHVEPFHEWCIEAAAQVIDELNFVDDREKSDSMGNLLYHFIGCWWATIRKDKGIIGPTAKSTAEFVEHMVACHEMPHESATGCLELLVHFASLVITKSGGRLV